MTLVFLKTGTILFLNQGSPLAYASANGPSAPLGPNNRQLSQMLLPTTAQAHLQAQYNPQNFPLSSRVFLNTSGQPVSRLMYIPTMGQSIHLGPDGKIRMKQDKVVESEEINNEMGAFVNGGSNNESGGGEKELVA